MRICSDGFMDLRDQRRVRTPGDHQDTVEPLPVREAVGFLLSHTFPGHRKVIRPLTQEHCRSLRLAMWATSVSERMGKVDRVWRAITEPVPSPINPKGPVLIQKLQVGPDWVFPLYLTGESTRAIPPGGEADWGADASNFDVSVMELDATATV